MGKLAERYSDHTRSAVYRVGDALIPIAAAREAGAHVLVGDARLIGTNPALVDSLFRKTDGAARVLIVRNSAKLARKRSAVYRDLLERLTVTIRASAGAGVPFFAVLVDPEGQLPLPTLYKEREITVSR